LPFALQTGKLLKHVSNTLHTAVAARLTYAPRRSPNEMKIQESMHLGNTLHCARRSPNEQS
jgi:hypothetical protein